MKLPIGLKPTLWGVAMGAAAMAFAGFTFMGWKTNDAAERLARAQVQEAVVAAMVPFCVAKAKHDADATPMTRFRTETSSYARIQLVQTAGWATLAGASGPDYALASACAERLQSAAN